MRKTCSVAGAALFAAMFSMAGFAQGALEVVLDLDRVIEILHGQRAVTVDTARRLGNYFGTSAEFWMNLQQIYELRRHAHGE
jgi:addiction module HigA family antidote